VLMQLAVWVPTWGIILSASKVHPCVCVRARVRACVFAMCVCVCARAHVFERQAALARERGRARRPKRESAQACEFACKRVRKKS